ncbi:HTH-domain containing protein [Ruegeria phage vB_RpoS-V16]|uniref:transcriptional regulator n=1 Tax=Ruegeria phage vB_RpoS-V16 TaxID=2218618 RepID=UPI000DCAB550|nr:transcriptional regulator [Ruegeria phage vB_RpoS-V16]AWY09504.1 HTH-domain containing protein [Ruegeria phage vB_RpoS-V16]
MQETTQEFSARLRRAIEGHPLAPPTPYGQQAWLLEKLTKETSLRVSRNAMSKWFNGQAKPRSDSIRQIAQVLKVDEVWLALGRKPTVKVDTPENAARSRAVVLVLAGLIESGGGRVTFPGPDAAPVDLQVNFGGQSLGLVVVALAANGDKYSAVVNEPTGDARVLALCIGKPDAGCLSTACVEVYDITDLPRQKFGGFSVVEFERRKGAKLKHPERKSLVAPLERLEEIGAA